MLKQSFILTFVVVGTLGHAALQPPVFNQSPLAAAPFANFPLGSVKAHGWLHGQLQNQRLGLTGNAEEVIPELGPDSGWRGGKGESWEKGPYYLKGLVSLAYTLDDAGLRKKAAIWVDAILASQQPDGFYGPGERQKVDWWPRMVVNWALRDYYEATGDTRVLGHLANYYRYMAKNLPQRPLFEWGKTRAADEMDTVFWLYNRTGDATLLETAALLKKQAWDWVDIFANNKFQHLGTFYTYHNVNIPQAFKFPLMSYQLTKASSDADSLTAGWQHLERENGLSFGMISGTEFLSGNSPSQGTEMCSFVEQMLSFYTATRVLGAPEWLDKAEKIAFNGMPAGLTKDFKQYQYYTLPNQVIAKRGPQHFNQEYDDGVCLGPHSGCHCCCYNLHMGWPKFAQHAWMATADHGVAAMLYAPTELQTTVKGKKLTIKADTHYPFAETVTLKVALDAPMAFPLHLHIPKWCAKPAVSVNGQAQPGVTSNSFFVITRQWAADDVVVLSLPMHVKTVPGVLHTVSVERGPLVYALKIGEKMSPVNSEPLGFHDLQCEPTTPWNYALELDVANPEAAFRFEMDAKMPANPFLLASVTLRLVAKAKRLPDWKLAASGVVALDPPLSPVASSAPLEDITLVPIGATTLHITSFPWLGTPVVRPKVFKADFNDGTFRDWVLYGGNCAVNAGELTLGPDNNYLKAVVPSVQMSDFVLSADFTIGGKGDGGVLFRATAVATGPDAHAGYYVGLEPRRAQLVIGKHNGKSWQPIATTPVDAKPKERHRLKIEAKGNQFQIFLGNPAKLVHEFTDTDHAAGTVGVREYGADYFKVDNFEVESR